MHQFFIQPSINPLYKRGGYRRWTDGQKELDSHGQLYLVLPRVEGDDVITTSVGDADALNLNLVSCRSWKSRLYNCSIRLNMNCDIEDIQECPADSNLAGKVAVCDGCPGKDLCLSQVSQPDPDQQVIDLRLKAIKHKILVLSGKGGVGKSSVSAMLSQMLANDGKKVGLLDVDICGPSIPSLLGIADQPIVDSQWGWKPVLSSCGKIKTLSVGSLLSSGSQAVVWRGPRKTSLIRRMIKDTLWGRLDALIVDTPPGTSDEHLTIVKLLAAAKPDGAVIVTSPQKLSAGVVSREIRFCQKMKVPVLGIIENMSGFTCTCCSEVTQIFSSGAGEYLAKKYGIPFLGALPLDTRLIVAQEKGLNIEDLHPQSPVVLQMRKILREILVMVGEIAVPH